MEKLDKALKFAIDAHKGQVRKLSRAPYILHPMEVGVIVGSLTDDEDTIAAAVLHDVVEDTDRTIDEIREKFGDRVSELVMYETENKYGHIAPDLTWKRRKEDTLLHLNETDDVCVKIMWLGDKLSNMRSLLRDYMKDGDNIWQFFNQKDKREQKWYYSAVADALRDSLGDTSAFKEYEEIIRKIFGDDE
ncbi:MAG: bifunctional (p)ppGpp synthetase/guanosine-3',5'-bis(diphosphate) 3'-pyrophosphohydrolase [Clostridia bacterium]|nr:bifunctional (p)ppGpp synthetase/guanosine-3',5'-bis(diphosphate) 3'-pyrophosphohydrolase [Clostridia bacterium]